jgi:hypothetical protein
MTTLPVSINAWQWPSPAVARSHHLLGFFFHLQGGFRFLPGNLAPVASLAEAQVYVLAESTLPIAIDTRHWLATCHLQGFCMHLQRLFCICFWCLAPVTSVSHSIIDVGT